jgi:hypothetical protein
MFFANTTEGNFTMLGTLLDKLGTLLPKNFIIANFFPVLLFASSHAVVLWLISGPFREWCQRFYLLDAGKQTLFGLPLLLSVALTAYIFSTLSLFLREILEGKYLPSSLRTSLTATQQEKIDATESDLKMYRLRRRKLKRQKGVWIKRMREARAEGNKLDTACTYSTTDLPSKTIRELIRKRARQIWVNAEDLGQAVDLLEQELKKCPVDKRDSHLKDIDNKKLLGADQDALYKIIGYTDRDTENEYIAKFNEREFNYSTYKLAPTTMGNIAESVRGYAMSRYAINLDPFWSRLQKILQNDEKFYASLLDAKTQLDFLISLFWLTVIFTAIWLPVLFYLRRSVFLFLVIGIGGPVLSMLWYKIALQNYRAFADILRTSVDLYRLDLLSALHIRLPAGNEHERRIWEELNQIIGYGDDALKVSYQHPPE